MHLSLILIAIGIAWAVRCGEVRTSAAWVDRWQRSLSQFLFPPLLLTTTALAVLGMGVQGQMLGLPVGWIGYSLALGFLGFASVSLLWLAQQGWRSLWHIQTYPQFQRQTITGRILNASTLFAAQIGFWNPELVVSQGLFSTLDPAQLDAVLTHEQAHRYYRDTFWFFWLGWVRHLTSWLPQTDSLWQELLLLRELRADRWAAQRVDPLLLAESLLLVVKAPLVNVDPHCAAFGAVEPLDRLNERIDALISPQPIQPNAVYQWIWLLLALSPLLTVVLHS